MEVDGAQPLSDVLADPFGLIPADATVRFEPMAAVVLRTIWMNLWPWVFVAAAGCAVMFARAARRGHLERTLWIGAVVVPITIIVILLYARRVVISKGSQLCVVALTFEVVALLGVDIPLVTKDGNGTVARHPLLASEAGLTIRTDSQPVPLRERNVSVELAASRSGRISRFTFVRGDRRVRVRVRGATRVEGATATRLTVVQNVND
jgi:hypothetical protein